MNQLTAQDFSELYRLYQQKKITALQQQTQQLAGQYPDKDEIQFFKALSLENGDEAVKIYEQLYLRAAAGEVLKNELSKKLSQYYYARGLYVRAAEFDKTPATASPIPPGAVPLMSTTAGVQTAKPTQDRATNYIIQVGAFGEEENARQLQKSLHARKFKSSIVERTVNGRTLYCVWVNGGASLDETLRLADKIKNRFNLEYRILKN
jgi:cell division protein FtsN